MADNQDRGKTVQERINAALESDIPKINFNGILITLGTGDIMVVLERNSQPVTVLNASYTVAKTLSVMLGNAIANLEEISGHTIMTTHEIEKFIAAKKSSSPQTGEKHDRDPRSSPQKRKH